MRFSAKLGLEEASCLSKASMDRQKVAELDEIAAWITALGDDLIWERGPVVGLGSNSLFLISTGIS